MYFYTCNSVIKNVSIDSIDFSNIDYKISRDSIDEKLVKSVKVNGLLEPPVLLEENKTCIIITGHNRLQVLKELEVKSIDSIIVKEIDHDIFLEYAVLKNYRGEVGPAGKIRYVRLLKELFKLDREKNLSILKQLQIPADIFYAKDPWDKAGILTDSLRIYIDSKDLSFKNIKDILRLPEKAVSLLSEWSTYGMRLNIFRGLIDMVSDILKRDKTVDSLKYIDVKNLTDRRQKEELIFREVFNIRYPEYSEIKVKADSIIKQLNASGFNVNFPEYFESDEIGINLKVNKREGVEYLQKKLGKVDMELFISLFELL